MCGIPLVEGHATNLFWDNESVVKVLSRFGYVLKNKHRLIYYNVARWGVAADIVTVWCIDTKENLSSAFTERLTNKIRN